MVAERDLQGAVVVVSGASSGIGRAAALAFAGHGARLVLAARSAPALAEVAEQCRASGAETITCPTDITDHQAAQALSEAALERFGAVDVWVEAAAVLIAGRLEDHPAEELQRLVDTNVVGNALAAQAALRVFRRQRHGVLIIVSSLLGLFPSPLAPAYAMSKFAMRGLALTLRLAVADEPNVHVCTVLPGPVDTPMFQRAANHTGRRLRSIPPAYAPERVAAAIVACARRPRRQSTAGVASHALLVSHRIAPRLTEAVVGTWSARTLTRAEPAPDSTGVLFEAQPSSTVHGGWRRVPIRRRLGEQYGTWLGQRGASKGGRPPR